MKKKASFTGICMMFVLGLTACGQTAQQESATEDSQELVVVEEETKVATVENPVEESVAPIESKTEVKVKEVAVKTELPKEEAKQDEETTVKVMADGAVDESDFAADINGVTVKLREDINELLDALGEPDDFVEAQSCLHDGKDKMFYYGGMTVYTYPDSGKDIVNIIEFNGEEKTLSGIGIGSTKEQIKDAYGTDYVEDPSYITYEYSDNATISFEMSDGKCIYIELYWE